VTRMTSLAQDTVADKVMRFVIGAGLGAGGTWYGLSDSVLPCVGAALLMGSLAVLFGNRFIEHAIKKRWWA
jgi:hypothetical protein